MPCRNCGTGVEASYNFCPTCATPQTDEARRRLTEYIDTRSRQQGTRKSDRSGNTELRRRVQYAVGYVAIVAGLATLTAGAGLFFLLAGLAVLPPVRQSIEAKLGRPLEDRIAIAAVGGLFLVGTVTFVLV